MMRCSNFRALNHVDPPILLLICIFPEFRLKIFHHFPIYKITILVHSVDLQSFIMTKNRVAERSKEELEKEGIYRDAFVTEITPFRTFMLQRLSQELL